MNRCIVGDCRDGLREMIASGIRAQTCVTSPPYWGLRDYGHPGQLGLEENPAEYVDRMVEVFRLVRDVLADDGTLWLNLGDSYAASGRGGGGGSFQDGDVGTKVSERNNRRAAAQGFKPKDLVGIPWRVAFALQADGWYLRSDIIWHKPNPMPESVRDRPTKAHEYLFLLAKSERYFYDADATKEPASDTGRMTGRDGRQEDARARPPGSNPRTLARVDYTARGRNKRSVWTVPVTGLSGAHFATFPPALIEPCIMAGSRPGDVVLDPFMGSGTTAMVAQNLGRRWIGCELNPEYIRMQDARASQGGLILELQNDQQQLQKRECLNNRAQRGGETGIRTLDTVPCIPDFESAGGPQS